MGRVKHPLKYGISKERLVAQRLRRNGFQVALSPASRGASDLKARGPKKWDIQVKASACNGSTALSSSGCRRIKIQARKDNAVPVHTKVHGNRVEFRSVRTGKKLQP